MYMYCIFMSYELWCIPLIPGFIEAFRSCDKCDSMRSIYTEKRGKEAEPTELGGRRGMMEFLPRLRVMFRGEDPEVEAMLGFQRGKYIWIELWTWFFIVFDFRLDESYFHAFADLWYLWFSCLPLCIPTTIYNMFYILWLMMAFWITLSQFPFSLLVLLWRHLPTESRRPTSLERWLIACFDPCCIYKCLCVFPYVSWVLLTDTIWLCDWYKIEATCILYSLYIYNFKTRFPFWHFRIQFLHRQHANRWCPAAERGSDGLASKSSFLVQSVLLTNRSRRSRPTKSYNRVNERDQLVGKHFFLWLLQFWYFRFVWSRVEVKTGRPGNVDVAELEVIMQEVQLDFARAMNLGTCSTCWVFREMQCKIEQSCRIESVFFLRVCWGTRWPSIRTSFRPGKIIVEATFEESLWRPGW